MIKPALASIAAVVMLAVSAPVVRAGIHVGYHFEDHPITPSRSW